tara:strand:+ start:571 stop:843 length:273 start_codon:yes stop_codon:yes gene_type:complete
MSSDKKEDNNQEKQQLQLENEDYGLEWWPLRFDRGDGRILFFGFPLFGCWLPFVGFITFYNSQGEEYRCFMLEWVLKGVILHREQDDEQW